MESMVTIKVTVEAEAEPLVGWLPAMDFMNPGSPV